MCYRLCGYTYRVGSELLPLVDFKPRSILFDFVFVVPVRFHSLSCDMCLNKACNKESYATFTKPVILARGRNGALRPTGRCVQRWVGNPRARRCVVRSTFSIEAAQRGKFGGVETASSRFLHTQDTRSTRDQHTTDHYSLNITWCIRGALMLIEVSTSAAHFSSSAPLLVTSALPSTGALNKAVANSGAFAGSL